MIIKLYSTPPRVKTPIVLAADGADGADEPDGSNATAEAGGIGIGVGGVVGGVVGGFD